MHFLQNAPPSTSNDFFHNPSIDVGQAIVASRVAVRELLVIEVGRRFARGQAAAPERLHFGGPVPRSAKLLGAREELAVGVVRMPQPNGEQIKGTPKIDSTPFTCAQPFMPVTRIKCRT